ncbi:thioredoxin H4-1-like [Mercurialis annua]|uniref:thioredoxin H4-1-like n=1 Tax=Mercurialis annua TaxID=3986 RepID=UPI0021602579|nr:thioredoxin H4-1-like [Mercurialis annua]
MGHCWSKGCICCHKINNGDGDMSNSQSEHVKCICKCDSVHQVNTIQKWEEKLHEATKQDKIIIVNFCSSWCSPSKSIAPIYCDLADRYSSVIFLSIDTNELRELSSSWEVKSTPTFFFLKDGRQLDKLVGADKLELEKKTAYVISIANGSDQTR